MPRPRPKRPWNRPHFIHARIVAKKLGLYLLLENDAKTGERWRVSCLTTGRFVLNYWPAMKRYQSGWSLEFGEARNWRDALDVAVKVRDQIKESSRAKS